MNVKQLSAMVPASFQCHAIDDAGEWVEGTVKIKVNRLSFRDVTQEAFQKAMENAENDPEVLGGLLAKCVGWWDVFTDETGTEMLPITIENIIDRPFSFTMSLTEAVMGVLFPNQTRATNSPDGSAREEKLASAAKTSSTATPTLQLAATGE